MKKLIFSFLLLFSLAAFAGPPEDAKKFMIPFPVICTPGMSSMMSSLTTDYAVHIAMTFEETPITGIVIMHNPQYTNCCCLTR
jgi:hypothetical protein